MWCRRMRTPGREGVERVDWFGSMYDGLLHALAIESGFKKIEVGGDSSQLLTNVPQCGFRIVQ